jgi:hypothetical protein
VRFGKSKEEADQEPARGGGGGDFIRYLKEGATTIRILQEQEEWKYYWEHFSPANFSFPCSGEADCPGCTSDNDKMKKVSRKIAFNALNSFNGVEYVNVWKVGPTVADKLENRIKRFNTITDRDYTITRYKSSGDRWDFDVEGDVPTPVNLRKEEWKDIEAMLQQSWDEAWGNPDLARVNQQATEMAAEPQAEPRRGRMTIAPQQSEQPPFEEKVVAEGDLRKMDHPDLLKLIKAEMDLEPPATLVTTDSVVDWMLDLQS